MFIVFIPPSCTPSSPPNQRMSPLDVLALFFSNQTEPIDASDSHVIFFFKKKYIFPLQHPLQRAGNESGVFLPEQETP